MGMVLTDGLMVQFTLETGSTMSSMEKVIIHGVIIDVMLVNGSIIGCIVKEK